MGSGNDQEMELRMQEIGQTTMLPPNPQLQTPNSLLQMNNIWDSTFPLDPQSLPNNVLYALYIYYIYTIYYFPRGYSL